MNNPDGDKQIPRLTPAQSERVREALKGMDLGLKGIDLSKMLSSVTLPKSEQLWNSMNLSTLGLSHMDLGIDLSKSLSLNLSKYQIDLPALGLDYSHLFAPALNFENLGFNKMIDSSSLKIFDEIYNRQRSQFEGIFKGIDRYLDSILPPNWQGVRKMDQLEMLMLDEGLALAWVPPSDILADLLEASSKQERRRILGKRWKRIVAACRVQIESLAESEYEQYQRFCLKIIEMLEAGHSEGAQALAANLLDTMLRETLDGKSRKDVTNQRNRLVIDDLPMRAAIVFGGIWGSHTEFWQSRGDAIPREFTRHGSAHAVSRRQYSRVNAVIALMHVTSYIMLLESGDLA